MGEKEKNIYKKEKITEKGVELFFLVLQSVGLWFCKLVRGKFPLAVNGVKSAWNAHIYSYYFFMIHFFEKSNNFQKMRKTLFLGHDHFWGNGASDDKNGCNLFYGKLDS